MKQLQPEVKREILAAIFSPTHGRGKVNMPVYKVVGHASGLISSQRREIAALASERIGSSALIESPELNAIFALSVSKGFV